MLQELSRRHRGGLDVLVLPLANLVCLLAPPALVPASEARVVVAAIRREAQRNARLTKPRAGDDLTERYVRAAAAAARQLPGDRAAGAFLVGLGIGLDDSEILRKNPFTSGLCRKVESDEERKERLAVLGRPTMRARRDLCQHFAVSCAMTEVVGPALAESAGVLKELSDSRGGTGFSFADLAANLSGIHLAARLKAGERDLDVIEKRFRVTDFVPSAIGLPEDLSAEQFASAFGSVEDRRFKERVDKIRQKIRKLPGHR